MTFSIYLPDNPEGQKQKTLIWLSGLTCTEENFRVKSGVQRFASEHNMIIVSPDTSPRGDDVPDDDSLHMYTCRVRETQQKNAAAQIAKM